MRINRLWLLGKPICCLHTLGFPHTAGARQGPPSLSLALTRHQRVHFSEHGGTSYLRVHLLTLDLGECHAGEVHAVCRERHPQLRSDPRQLRPPREVQAVGQPWAGTLRHGWAEIGSTKRGGFGAVLCSRSPTLTFLLHLRLPSLGGGHHSGRGLGDAPGGLLELAQVGAVLVRLHLPDSDGGALRLPLGEQETPPWFGAAQGVPEHGWGAASVLPAGRSSSQGRVRAAAAEHPCC